MAEKTPGRKQWMGAGTCTDKARNGKTISPSCSQAWFFHHAVFLKHMGISKLDILSVIPNMLNSSETSTGFLVITF